MKNKILFFIFSGLFIRFLIMPFLAHPDIFWINWGPYYLSEKGILNIYHFFGDLNNNHLFKYPPLAYFVLGINILFFKPFLHGLNIFNSIKDPHTWNIWFNSIHIFRHLFFLKIIYLVSDILIILLILKLFEKSFEKNKSLKYWTVNPFILYSVYAYGQFDIIPVFFIVLTVYLFKKKYFFLSSISLGIGGMIKQFPLLLLPFLLLCIDTNKIRKIFYFILTISIYAIVCIPFLNSPSFINDVLINSTNYIVNNGNIFTDTKIYFIICYLFIFIYFILKKKSKPNYLMLNRIFLLVLTIYLSLTEFHPQFIVWIAPLLIIEITSKSGTKFLYVILIITFFIYSFKWGRNTSSVLLYPVNSVFYGMPSPKSVLDYLNLSWLIKISKILFSLSLFFLIFKKPVSQLKQK